MELANQRQASRRCLTTRRSSVPAIRRCFASSIRARPGAQPGDVRRRDRGAARPRSCSSRDIVAGAAGIGFAFQIVCLAVVHRAVRQLRRGGGRGARQGAGRRRLRRRRRPKPWPSAWRRRRRSVARRCRRLELKIGDIVLVEAGDLIPGDGEVIEGVAIGRRSRPSPANPRRSSARAAATARPSPAARGCSPTGSRCASRRQPGSTFLDRMIALVEGAERQKTPNEIALNILLAGMTIIFVLAVVDHPELRRLCRRRGPGASCWSALFVTLIPTTIGALLSAIGIAGMDRLVRFNVLAMSGRAVEAAGDVDTLLLDKTGTITLGNRQATRVRPAAGRRRARAGRGGAARLAGRRDAGGPLDRRAGQGEVRPPRPRHGARCTRSFVPFTAQTRMSGVDVDGARRSARARSMP